MANVAGKESTCVLAAIPTTLSRSRKRKLKDSFMRWMGKVAIAVLIARSVSMSI